jgi:dihydrofolate reductase
MIYSHIVAAANNGVIGKDNDIPWDIKVDMQFFKRKTSSHIIIMGRKTFESMRSKPLPNRTNIVISRTLKPSEGIHVFDSIDKAVTYCETLKAEQDKEVFFIGGEGIYKGSESYVSKIYLTKVDMTVENGNAFYHLPKGFSQVSSEKVEENGIQLEFTEYTK